LIFTSRAIILFFVDIAQIIAELGGTGEVAAFCGVQPSAVSNWRNRNSIPVEYWPRIVTKAVSHGIKKITLESLMAANVPTAIPAEHESAAVSKYATLGDFLRRQKADEIPMTFDWIEKVSGAKLPPSAKRYRAWWSNNSRNSVITKVWLEAGFKSAQVDVEKGRLVFRRVRRSQNAPPDGRVMDAPALPHRHPLIGALKGLIHVDSGTDLTAPADPEWGERAGVD
jgi:hypothetical protein